MGIHVAKTATSSPGYFASTAEGSVGLWGIFLSLPYKTKQILKH